MPAAKSIADVQISKAGPNGRPVAVISVDPSVSIDKVTAAVQKNITRNRDILKKFGLKACQGCISGFDLDIRHKFEHVMQVDLEQIG